MQPESTAMRACLKWNPWCTRRDTITLERFSSLCVVPVGAQSLMVVAPETLCEAPTAPADSIPAPATNMAIHDAKRILIVIVVLQTQHDGPNLQAVPIAEIEPLGSNRSLQTGSSIISLVACGQAGYEHRGWCEPYDR